jgi:hypothetical protein
MALKPYKRRQYPQTAEVPAGFFDGEYQSIEQSIRTVIEALLPAVALPSSTVALLPDPELYEGRIIYVSNEAGGAVIAFSDGTDWRRVTDRAVVS